MPADFDAGTDYTVFRLTNNDVRVAPLICFEDSIGELTRQFVIKGASCLVNVTNDGWFLRSAGSRQHLANAIFRCVETRRPMVRAANTGVTCFVNEFGRVTSMLEKDGDQFIDGVLSSDVAVPTQGGLTFYVRHGELFARCCAALSVGALFIGFVRRRSSRKSQPVTGAPARFCLTTVSEPVIHVRGLRKSYGALEAVKGIDFEVHAGEVFGLLGPNGAGKTTTVEILEGLRPRSGGEVTVLGFDPDRQKQH